MNKELLLLGAFDRYNYGDLLFPIIFKKYIEVYRNDIYNHYSKIIPTALENSDLSKVGGLPTVAWKDLNKNTNKDVIVVGGDVLGATTSGLYLDSLDSFYKQIVMKIVKKYINKNYIQYKADKKFQVNNILPYVPNYSEENIKNITYNAVSGSGLISQKIDDEHKKIIINRLEKSSYVSVRDNKSQEALVSAGIDVKLSPDSAAVMSDFFPLSELSKEVSDKNILSLQEKKYVVLQVGYWKSKNNINEIVEQLKLIYSTGNVEVVLLPIGFASNHDDLIALNKISNKLDFKHYYFKDISIWDIMFIIGSASFFLGTSLHGNITAMSFGVPNMGLNKNIYKLDKYLNSWGTKPFNKCINFNEIYDQYIKSKDFDKEALQVNQMNTRKLVYENNNNLLNMLLS
ncbi:hypothetical protein GMD78_03255 [Ornithinibacillus sp. L9]|uniref:Polysaccharide pyruvyl transferase domain-containing protein n=1 Tax=Ornithinibacillus caprae TaxID=2678566 RepID=A0A6N8FI42_9BACI|nr:polysaccharide pyruvyl transferase family protein [Ornithinibacillus caprae]MUK87419.1 hypothetical protein [Ornithinibacillus caprae]